MIHLAYFSKCPYFMSGASTQFTTANTRSSYIIYGAQWNKNVRLLVKNYFKMSILQQPSVKQVWDPLSMGLCVIIQVVQHKGSPDKHTL